jgi:LmbE family N-acetylglucosaminyl deacetylase
MLENKRILFIGSHPDDIEFGCGGIISSIKNKNNLYCLTLARMNKYLKSPTLIDEHFESLKSLGIKEENITLSNYEERNFLKYRQEICDYLYEINSRIKPELVFTHPPLSDMHQDHETVSKEALRVFHHCGIIGFEVPPSFYYKYNPNFYYRISKEDVENKLKALSCYRTYKTKPYFSPDIIKAQLITNGNAVYTNYAERFTIIRLIL